MPKASPIQTSFNAGEFSSLMYGRVDTDGYPAACRELVNYIPMREGPAKRRPGSMFVAPIKTQTAKSRLLPFQFNTLQAYMIEAGNTYFRFYKNHAQILSGPSTPYEISTPYLTADLFQIKQCQSADVLYLFHPGYQTRKLSRTGDTSWTLTAIDFSDGPYLSTNAGTTTITPSATTGAGITLTASAALFAATDVGRLVRIKHTSTWGWARITAFTSSTVVTATVISAFGATTASASWRLGLFWGTNWPACGTFFQDRLFMGGSLLAPQRIDGSVSGDYENFSPSLVDGTVTDENAIARTLNATNVNVVRWMSENEKGLAVGTVGAEWICRASNLGEAITPSNFNASKSTSLGSANIQPVNVGKAILFVQRAQRRLHELAYVFADDGFNAPDLTVRSSHISKSGLTEIAYQQEPINVLWCARTDGYMAGLTYDRSANVNAVGWHRHSIGGQGIAGEDHGLVESVAVIPSPDGLRDELWMIVARNVGPIVNPTYTRRYIEYLTPIFDDSTDQKDAFFVDCGLTYSGAPATVISGLAHLDAVEVEILADGAAHPNRTVGGGQITLQRAASKVHVGLANKARLQPLRIEAGAADGTAQGKTKRITNLTLRLDRTLGLEIGDRLDNMEEIQFRTSADPMDQPVPLFSGDKFVAWPGGYETDGNIIIQSKGPFPSTISALMPQLDTQDR